MGDVPLLPPCFPWGSSLFSGLQVTGKYRSIAPPTAADLVRAFTLTPTEAEVTVELAAGRSVADIATARGVSVYTIRTHLKRVMVKTGTHSQAALVSKVFRGAQG